MEARGARLATAREARQLRQLNDDYCARTVEWELINAECQELMHEEEALREDAKTKTERYGTVVARIRFLSELIAVRQAPHARAHKALDATLETGALTLDDPLDDLALDDDGFFSLEQAITNYQQEYAAILSRCKELGT
ncbi:MAG: hypothetical protein LBU48_05955 [Coriobacteriales bacterium]|nr:hypothetical protein [Coriobacteriales bacterium]